MFSTGWNERGGAMVDWRSWGVLIAGAICFGSFVWGAKFHFHTVGKAPRGMQVLSLASFAAFAGFLYGISTLPGGFRWVPFGLCVVSLLLFWWCILYTSRKRFTLAFSPDAPVFLDTQGPYRMARHPFYLSYMLFWVATALAVPGALPWLVPAILAALYTFAAMKEERKFTSSAMEREYRTYRMRTGMFFPMLTWQRRKERQA